MPEFDTPEPITATIEPGVGHVRIVASKRTTTHVEVVPGTASDARDARAAEQTRVTCSGGRLLVKGPRPRPFGAPGSIDVLVELPAGSAVHGNLGVGDLVSEGPLGVCEIKTGAGDLQIEQAEQVELRTGHGDVTVDRVTGTAGITGNGRVRLGTIGGTATVKNSNGDIHVAEVTGHLKAASANGSLHVEKAHRDVDARTANGRLELGEVRSGKVTLGTAAGGIKVGIAPATAAWLDVHSKLGRVRNELTAAEAPEPTEETVEVHARTGLGDILISRA
ncbi:DUF4097 family beta strand repeat-containing protein [Streptomyces sp. NPDC002851]